MLNTDMENRNGKTVGKKCASQRFETMLRILKYM